LELFRDYFELLVKNISKYKRTKSLGISPNFRIFKNHVNPEVARRRYRRGIKIIGGNPKIVI
jgi:hypothetical protein